MSSSTKSYRPRIAATISGTVSARAATRCCSSRVRSSVARTWSPSTSAIHREKSARRTYGSRELTGAPSNSATNCARSERGAPKADRSNQSRRPCIRPPARPRPSRGVARGRQSRGHPEQPQIAARFLRDRQGDGLPDLQMPEDRPVLAVLARALDSNGRTHRQPGTLWAGAMRSRSRPCIHAARGREAVRRPRRASSGALRRARCGRPVRWRRTLNADSSARMCWICDS